MDVMRVAENRASRCTVRPWVLSVVAVLVLHQISPVASADVILAQHDWDPVPASGVWQAGGTSAGVSVTNTGAPHDNWLKIDFPSGLDPEAGPKWDETASVAATNFFVGTWSTQMWIAFDFWAESVVPRELQVVWHGTASNNVWSYPLTSGVQAGQWTTLRASFANWDDWGATTPYVGVDAYLADLDSMDWIGVYIWRSDSVDQEIYGLDDFKLMVPEPEEYAMLLAGLATALMVYRRRHHAA